MSRTVTARWTDWEGRGLEHLVLRFEDTRIVAEGALLSGGEEPVAAIYRVQCNSRWRVRAASISVIETDEALMLTADGIGNWFDEARTPLRPLHGAIDIDLSLSPFTNTLPIRRTRLGIGESVDITTAYINLPELSVTPDPQRYTRLSERRYHYESRDGDFSREIEVDADGLVVSYEGLFRRVL
jgi:uncharacterized protein